MAKKSGTAKMDWKDPFGIEWGISTHKEDLTDEQIAERAKEFFASMGSDCG